MTAPAHVLEGGGILTAVGASAGTVTLLFTDVEGSTLLGRIGADRYKDALSEHHGLLRDAVGTSGGHEVDVQGEGRLLASIGRRKRVHSRTRAEPRLA